MTKSSESRRRGQILLQSQETVDQLKDFSSLASARMSLATGRSGVSQRAETWELNMLASDDHRTVGMLQAKSRMDFVQDTMQGTFRAKL